MRYCFSVNNSGSKTFTKSVALLCVPVLHVHMLSIKHRQCKLIAKLGTSVFFFFPLQGVVATVLQPSYSRDEQNFV